MNKIIKILGDVTSTFLIILMFLSGNIVVQILGLPVILVFSARLLNIIQGNKIKNSIFSVTRSGKIFQNSFAQPFRIFKMIRSKNKQELFIQEARIMFEQLPRTDKNSKVIRYFAVSHSFTYKLLSYLEKNGYVTNLEKTPHKKSNLFFEKLLIENLPKKNKRYQMYNISFELTEKRLKDEVGGENNSFFQNTVESGNEYKKNKDSNNYQNTVSDRINELKELREELMGVENTEVKDRIK